MKYWLPLLFVMLAMPVQAGSGTADPGTLCDASDPGLDQEAGLLGAGERVGHPIWDTLGNDYTLQVGGTSSLGHGYVIWQLMDQETGEPYTEPYYTNEFQLPATFLDVDAPHLCLEITNQQVRPAAYLAVLLDGS